MLSSQSMCKLQRVYHNCQQIITLQYIFIIVMEYMNITLLKNQHINKLIEIEYHNEYN